MIINREDLLKALSTVKPAVGKSSAIDQMGHFLFTGEDIAAFNEKICIHYLMETDFECSIESDDLYNLIQLTSGEEIELNFSESEEEKKLIIKSSGDNVEEEGELNSCLDSGHVDRITSITEMLDNANFVKLPSNFIEGVQMCMFSASTDPISGTATCIHVKGDEIHAHDNSRASIYKMDGDMGEFMMDAGIISELSKLEIVEFALSDYWCHFATEDDITFSCKRIFGEEKDIKNVMDVKGVKITYPDKLKDFIDEMTFMAGDKDLRVIKIEIDTDQILMEGRKHQRGKLKKKIKMETGVDELISFTANPISLSQVLEHTKEGIVGEFKLYFKSGNYEHLLMMIMLED